MIDTGAPSFRRPNCCASAVPPRCGHGDPRRAVWTRHRTPRAKRHLTVVITNTLPLAKDKAIDKIEVLSVAQILADALAAVFDETA